MRYSNMILRQGIDCFKQVSKPTAKKLFDAGQDIYLLPSNVRFNNNWMNPARVNNVYDNFTATLANYIYYNCFRETGKYVNFFVKI